MQSNIEVKARVDDLERVEAIAITLSDKPCEILHQEDTFFNTPQGKLKLRQFGDRPDQGEAKQSHYLICPTAMPNELEQLLTVALGHRVVFKKTRDLYLVEQTRIHLDRVKDLGEFVELEVVLQPEQDPQAG